MAAPAPTTDAPATPPPAVAAAATNQGGFRSYMANNPWENLNALPTFFIVGGSAIVAMACTYVLQNHILNTGDHVGVCVLGSYVVFSSYFMIYFFLERGSSSFRKISQDKKFYTIGNLIKAGVLAAITPFAVHQLYRIVVYDSWDGNTLRNLGCIYMVPDLVSLIIIRRMAWTTVVHHICVIVFNYFSVQNDYAEENVCRLIVVYAAFSTFAYCVNMLLASRFLGVTPRVSMYLSKVALVVYVACCAINWTWQVHYIRHLLSRDISHWTLYVYMGLISLVMWDDIILNRWLLQNARNSHLRIAVHSKTA